MAYLTKPVKNLGWLRRHTADIIDVHVYPDSDGRAKLVAHLDGDVTFTTTFASYTVCLHWVQRPALRKLPVVLHPHPEHAHVEGE